MKKQILQKLLTSTATLLACTLLIGNTIPVPTPTDNEEGSSIVVELPSSDEDNENTEPGYSPLNDDKPLGGIGE